MLADLGVRTRQGILHLRPSLLKMVKTVTFPIGETVVRAIGEFVPIGFKPGGLSVLLFEVVGFSVIELEPVPGGGVIIGTVDSFKDFVVTNEAVKFKVGDSKITL